MCSAATFWRLPVHAGVLDVVDLNAVLHLRCVCRLAQRSCGGRGDDAGEGYEAASSLGQVFRRGGEELTSFARWRTACRGVPLEEMTLGKRSAYLG